MAEAVVYRPLSPLGAGSVSSTASDISRFAHLLFSGKFLSAESLEEMKRMDGNVGCGIFRIPFYERMAYGHGGSIDGYESVFGYFPQERIAFSILSNAINIAFNDISIALLSAVFGKEYKNPSFQTIVLKEEELGSYQGVYTSSKLPMQITIMIRDGRLFAQATGQAAFGLDAHGGDKFSFRQGGIDIVFSPDRSSLNLSQGGAMFVFKRKQ